MNLSQHAVFCWRYKYSSVYKLDNHKIFSSFFLFDTTSWNGSVKDPNETSCEKCKFNLHLHTIDNYITCEEPVAKNATPALNAFAFGEPAESANWATKLHSATELVHR